MIYGHTRIIDLTVDELKEIISISVRKSSGEESKKLNPEKRYVYGIDGLAILFGCSKWKANEIKQSGKIDAAIKQNGRKIIVDADLAVKLFKENSKL